MNIDYNTFDKYARAINMANDLAMNHDLRSVYHIYLENGEMRFSASFSDRENKCFSMEIPLEGILTSKYPEAIIRTHFFIVYNAEMKGE
jgi:hypothetical protein